MSDEVRVTAADFNGRTWDGFPFSDAPQWLLDANERGDITVKPDDRDYALWRVKTSGGDVIAEPGDTIIRHEDGTLRVRRYRS